MHLDIYNFYLPLSLMVVPWLVARWVFVTDASRGLKYWPAGRLLIAAGIMWDVAIYAPVFPGLPSDSFTTHLLGGVVAGFLFGYMVIAYQIKFKYWWAAVLAFFAFSSALAVLNENAELILGGTDTMAINLTDIQWDLAANTIGTLAYVPALLFWLSTTRRL